MSGAERSYRVALRAFPKQYREERGEEVIATILEGGDGWRPRIREFFGLFWAGVAQRSLQAGGVKTAGSVRAGIRLGVYFLFWLIAAGRAQTLFVYASHRFNGVPPSHYAFHVIGQALAAFLVLLALSRGRWTAPLAITFGWIVTEYSLTQTGTGAISSVRIGILAWTLLFLPPLLLIIARPRKDEPRDLRSPLWAVAAFAWGSLGLAYDPWLGLVPGALLLAWLVLGWRDLRLSIALVTLGTYWFFELAGFAFVNSGARPIALVWFSLFVPMLIVALSIAIGFAGRRVRA
ncbi:MAG: hypothetical protein WBQ14_06500 [Gaiellaceae bacterium]